MNFDSRGIRSLYNNGTSLTSITGSISSLDYAITMYDYTLENQGK
ncbi:hypothetical protein [Senegalia massiliensis]|nr:hypothetical protein [Senegalia massiliensis]